MELYDIFYADGTFDRETTIPRTQAKNAVYVCKGDHDTWLNDKYAKSWGKDDGPIPRKRLTAKGLQLAETHGFALAD